MDCRYARQWTENIITLCCLGQCNPDAGVFPQLDQLLHEAGSITLTARMNAGYQQWRCHNCSCDMIVMEKFRWYCITVPSEDPQSTLWWSVTSHHYFYGACLSPDDHPVQIQFCTWLLHQQATNVLPWHYHLWTYEACFMHEGVFTVHNVHY
jgi:hypothetical protein